MPDEEQNIIAELAQARRQVRDLEARLLRCLRLEGELWAALRKYAVHKGGGFCTGPGNCGCGLDAILRRYHAPRPEPVA